MGPPSLGPAHVSSLLAPELLSPAATAMVGTAACAASAVTSAMACVLDTWSVIILFKYLLFAETALCETTFLYCFFLPN